MPSSNRRSPGSERPVRERALAAAAQLGHQTDLHARMLAHGQSRTLGMIVSNLSNPSEFKAAWEVPYQPGELKAIGYRGAKPVGSAVLRTARDVSQIVVAADRDRIEADGQDLAYVTVELRDAAGTRNPRAENLLTFEIEGPGTIVGVGNANPVSLESYQRPERKAWQGQCLVIVKFGTRSGDIRLKVSSAGLTASQVRIRSGTGAP